MDNFIFSVLISYWLFAWAVMLGISKVSCVAMQRMAQNIKNIIENYFFSI